MMMFLRQDARHDGSPWNASDKARKRRSGQAFGFRALLEQVRGDWAWMKQVFGFKGWRGKEMCWMCRATSADGPLRYWNFGLSAKWRRMRHTTATFLAALRASGVELSVLFDFPGFHISMILVDVLHCCDLGCTQIILGNLFWWALTVKAVLPGKSLEASCKALLRMIKAFYKSMSTPCNRINDLSPEMIRQSGKGPRLRLKGPETRHIVPFSVELAGKLHDAVQSEFSADVLDLCRSLLTFYMTLGITPFNAAEASAATQRCLDLYTKLSDAADHPIQE